MTINAVVAKVDFAAHEPLGPGGLPFEHAGPRSKPVQLSGNLRPELFRILNGAAIKRLVLLKTLHVRSRGKLGWRGEDSLLAQDRIQIGLLRSRAGFHCFSSSHRAPYCSVTITKWASFRLVRLGNAAAATPKRCAQYRRAGCTSASRRGRPRFLPSWRSTPQDLPAGAAS